MAAIEERQRMIAKSEGPPEERTLKERCINLVVFHWRGFLLILFPILLLPIIFMNEEHRKALFYLYTLSLMVCYWTSEVLEMAIVSAFPIMAFPVFGILTSKQICVQYLREPTLLWVASSWLVVALEINNISKKAAFWLNKRVGPSPKKLHIVLMVVTFVGSILFNNTFVCVFMYSIADAALTEFQEAGVTPKNVDIENPMDKDDDKPWPSNIAKACYLGISISALTGSAVTLLGQSPNEYTPIRDKSNIAFLKVTLFNILPCLLLFILALFWLQLIYMGLFRPNSKDAQAVQEIPKDAYKAQITQKSEELGKLSLKQGLIVIFVVLVLVLLITRNPFRKGGWTSLYLPTVESGATVPIVGALFVMFVLPASFTFCLYCRNKRPAPEGPADEFIAWKFLNKRTPWRGMLILGGGSALASGFKPSGWTKLTEYAFNKFAGSSRATEQLVIIGYSGLFGAFLESTAFVRIITPVIDKFAKKVDVSAGYFTVPSILMLCFSFLYPSCNGPMATAAAWGNIRIYHIVGTCLILTLFAMAFVFVCGQTIIYAIWSEYS